MIKHSAKRGDTLIEVMLAVGIFSMVAVAVVAVMSGGTSSAQTALETTLAREEIDNQAEILRFIHRSYIADKNSAKDQSAFGHLWEEITNKAANDSTTGDIDEEVTKFHPSTCQELYDGSSDDKFMNSAFIIDPNQMSTYAERFASDNSTSDVLIEYDDPNVRNAKFFRAASTYPHLIYANNPKEANNQNNTNMNDHSTDATGSGNQLFAAEGIFVNVVKDPNSTTLAGKDTSASSKKAAYYDFYIRTCWYGTGDQSPSTISTVIRLYNPDITQ